MRKSDLKTGMQIEKRNGNRYVVMLDTMRGDVYVRVNGTKHGELNFFNDDLTYNNNSGFDIVAVYESPLTYRYLTREFDESECIWKRKEEKPVVTLDGVEYSESTLRSMIKKATE